MKLSMQTPEGVEVGFEVASLARRFMAFLVDNSIIMFVLFCVGILLVFTVSNAWGIAFFLLFSFVFRNFYFAVMELRGRGQTIGKRVMGIRVVDAYGRPLSGNAVFLRNVTRDVETVLPLVALFSPQALLPGAPAGLAAVAVFWLLGLALLPILAPNHTRAGDLIAGTVVILEPRLVLGSDLTKSQASKRFHFTAQQLDVYGIQEIQTLEKLLRDRVGIETNTLVAEKIALKIGYDGHWRDEPADFLLDFYNASRARHEARILLGDRQETKAVQ